MGTYTEIFVNVDLREDTPEEVINTLNAICKGNDESPYLEGRPSRWSSLFGNGSYYTPSTCCAMLTFDDISKQWSLLGKGDIKNYNGEIELFFNYIKKYCESSFIGYYRHEGSKEPTLVYN